MGNPWEPDFYPQWIWDLAANIVLPAAIIGAGLLLWKHGPMLLIEYGPKLFTRWGKRWQDKRENGNEQAQ